MGDKPNEVEVTIAGLGKGGISPEHSDHKRLGVVVVGCPDCLHDATVERDRFAEASRILLRKLGIATNPVTAEWAEEFRNLENALFDFDMCRSKEPSTGPNITCTYCFGVDGHHDPSCKHSK